MGRDSTISIAFKINTAGNGFKELTLDADALRRVMSDAIVDAEKLNHTLVNFASLSTGIDSVNQTINSLLGVMKELSDAHASQIEAETQLAVNMRNTMGAREDEIQSIKNLCAAQQELGVIGDEVQLSGAQELATYLNEKASLEKLIPVMNDMLAQQYGLNATQENAAQIATMLGKVMDGQTGALSRYGYTFDETQEKILKYGTEAQRAAVLCDVVSASVGGMNAELAKTDDGKLKQLENTIGDIKEELGGIAPKVVHVLTIGSNALTAAADVVKLTAAIKTMGLTLIGWISKTKLLNVVMFLATGSISKATQATRVFTTAAKGSAAAANVMKIAVRGLLVASGVGIAIAALTAIISHFISKADEAAGSTDKLTAAEEKAKREAEELEQMESTLSSTRRDAKAALEINMSRLKEFNGTKAEEKKLVSEMNDTYGETMGYFSSVAEWYKALTANSETYCRQMVVEARTRMLANKIAQKEQENHDIVYDEKGNRKKYSKKATEKERVRVGWHTPYGRIYGGSPRPIYEERDKADSSPIAKAQKAYDDNLKEIESLRDQMNQAAAEVAQIDFSVKGSDKRPENSAPHKKVVEQEKTRRAQLLDLINKAKEAYITASETEREGIRKNINAWNKEIDTIDALQREAERPLDISTNSNLDKEIAYQESLLKHASAENISLIEEEITRLKKVKTARERASHSPLPIEKIETYEQLNEELKYYQELLQTGTEEERIFAQRHLNDLGKIGERWKETLDELEKPAEIGALKTVDDLDKAITYYQQKQKKASADEIQSYQKTISALEMKRAALQRGMEIPSMIRDAEEINNLTGKEHRIKISGMGFEELTSKIEELNRLLTDTANPLTDSQRKDIESLVDVYSQWRKEATMSFDTLRSGWGTVKGLGDGMESLTSALSGNGNAWQTLTGIVDGFIQIYDGVMAIVGIINMLATVTSHQTVAEGKKAAAMGVSTTAQAAEAAAAEVTAAAQLPLIVANKAAAASFTELAASAYFAAHASIPFAGFGIASGFVASAAAMVQSIGAMPFANGGIVSGPTLGLIGEYAGASHNPEVVAPLDKLRDMLGTTGGGELTVNGAFRVSGRDLVCVLANETRIAGKSGRHTNIKI